MIPYIKLDERLNFYKHTLKHLFDDNMDLAEQLNIIQKYRLPSTLASIVSYLSSSNYKDDETDLLSKRIQILSFTLEAEGFFDSWDSILILAYISYFEFNLLKFDHSLDRYCRNNGSIVLDRPEVKKILEQLEQLAYEINNSLSYLISDLSFEKSQRQSDSETLDEVSEKFSDFLNSYIWDCHDEEEGKRLRGRIIKNMIHLYKSLDPIDGEQFKNMYENLGYIEYHGGDHGLYQMTQDQIRRELWEQVSTLEFKQKVSLVDEMSLDKLSEDISIFDLEDLDEFKDRALNSDVIDEILEDLHKEFIKEVPEYFPD